MDGVGGRGQFSEVPGKTRGSQAGRWNLSAFCLLGGWVGSGWSGAESGIGSRKGLMAV